MSAASTITGVATALPLHSDVPTRTSRVTANTGVSNRANAPPRSGGAAREPLSAFREREQQPREKQ